MVAIKVVHEVCTKSNCLKVCVMKVSESVSMGFYDLFWDNISTIVGIVRMAFLFVNDIYIYISCLETCHRYKTMNI